MELAIAIAANLALGVLLLGLFVGLRRPDVPSLAGADEALTIFRRRFPDAFGAATVASDGRGTLIVLRNEIGLLHLHGRRWNARKLIPGELSAVSIAPADTITLALADFGWPRARETLLGDSGAA